MSTGMTRRLASGAAVAITTVSLAGPATAGATSRPQPALTPVESAQANLRIAISDVKAFVHSGKNYPDSPKPKRLEHVLPGIPQATVLRDVFYRGTGTPVYTLSAWVKGTTYWISVIGRNHYFGSTPSKHLDAPAPDYTHGASPNPWRD